MGLANRVVDSDSERKPLVGGVGAAHDVPRHLLRVGIGLAG